MVNPWEHLTSSEKETFGYLDPRLRESSRTPKISHSPYMHPSTPPIWYPSQVPTSPGTFYPSMWPSPVISRPPPAVSPKSYPPPELTHPVRLNNISVTNAGHGDLVSYNYVPITQPALYQSPTSTPGSSPAQGTSPLTPAASTMVQYTRPPDIKHPTPWVANNSSQPVLDTQQLINARKDIAVQVNPILSASTKPFELSYDLRCRLESVFKMSLKDNKFVFEKWLGHNEPATLPKLNRITIICPAVEGEIVVANSKGVTCGDVLREIFNHFTREISTDEFSSHPIMVQQCLRDCFDATRANAGPYTALPGGIPVVAELLWDKCWFDGLDGSQEEYIKQRRGWVDPACFVLQTTRRPIKYKV
ncbi:hypothetical protein FRC03_011979 [Tulasnella sp. 419]|nr:hypothetical protein FRC02_010179 [Tulasnella sp. 418]KAG8966441.1 hypothetical protein FRC03_011979 [Tulasnella sp. 419]